MSYLNKNLFVILLMVGGGLSCVVRLLFDNKSGSVLAVIICVVCLFAYYLSAKRDTGLHNPDNCYYMGLLFTLVSLIFSLITVFLPDSGTDGVDDRVYNLIGSFGIALISTVAGILFRILLLQGSSLTGQPSNGGQDEQLGQLRLQAHADLAETAFKLRQELTQTIADMSIFRRTIIQASNKTRQDMEKACTAMTQQVERSANEQTKMLEKLSVTVVARLTESVNEVTDTINNIKNPLDDVVVSQSEQAQKIRDLSEKITNDGAQLVTSMVSILQPLQEVVNNLKSANQGVQAVSSNYDSLNSKLQQSITFISEFERQMNKAANALTATTETLSRSLAEAAEVTPRYSQQFKEFTAVLRGETEKWQSMTNEVNTSLTKAIKKLTDVINGNP